MTRTIPEGAGEALALFLVAVALFIAVMIVLDLVGVSIAGLLDRRKYRPVAPPRLIMPDRYPGCLTCEAVEALGSVRHMVRHQLDDHTGGVRW